jgi:hypothetical protein
MPENHSGPFFAFQRGSRLRKPKVQGGKVLLYKLAREGIVTQ